MAYSKYLANQGWNLELISQDKSRADKGKETLNYEFARYHLRDLSKPESIKSIVENIETPNLIVANAGITKSGKAGSLDFDEKMGLFYLLCNGVIDLIESYLPEMEQKKSSRIVIISSIGAVTPMPKSSIYAAAKSAIYSYGQSLSRELNKKNISVTVSLPGYVKTSAHQRAGLGHLNEKVPSWMWIEAEQVVKETEKASIKGKSYVIPGAVYKLVRPFLQSEIANNIWNKITKRNS